MESLNHLPKHSRGIAQAFTLVELLIVIGIIALMFGLIGPAVQGVLGVSGKRGGVNQLVNALEQTRMAAIENGGSASLAFPPASAPADVRGGFFMILRDGKDGQVGPVPLTRWQRLPQGVVLRFPNTNELAVTNFSTSLPKLQTQTGIIASGDLQLVKFDRFGRALYSSGGLGGGDGVGTINVEVGEGQVQDDGSVNWRGGQYETIQIQRLTGRILVQSQ